MPGITYKRSGVDIDLAGEFLEAAKASINKTFRPGVLTGIGHFGAFFQPDFTGYKEPVLVSSTDGVGTKIKVAQMAGIHNTIGQDLVNHCVNDIMCTGAQPLYFLDYYAMGKMDKAVSLAVIEGLCQAAAENDTALIGGETAEMPGIYQPGDYDLAGTIVGVVEKSRIIDGKNINPGDVMIGLPSTGLHTNGYSLARKICFEVKGFTVDTKVEGLENTIGGELLKIHRSYRKPLNALEGKVEIKGISHITGGGIEGNTRRILPEHRRMQIDWQAWRRPQFFKLLQEWGKVPEEDMRKTFNLGIGIIVIVESGCADLASTTLEQIGEKPVMMGEIV